MRNESEGIGIRLEAQRAQHAVEREGHAKEREQHAAERLKHAAQRESQHIAAAAERSKHEAVRVKQHDAIRLRNEAILGSNEENRTRLSEQTENPATRRSHSGSRSGRDGVISVITRIDLSEDQVEGSRGQYPHQHHSHHHHHSQQYPENDDESDTRRGGGPSRGHGRGGRGTRGGGGRGGGGRGGGGRGSGRGGGGGGGNREDHDSDHHSRFDVESQSSSTRPNQPIQSGKLFDPRKDDPVRFASLRAKYGMFPLASSLTSTSLSMASIGGSSGSDIRSLKSLDQSTNASSDGKERRRRRGPSSKTTNESGDGKRDGGQHNTNSYVLELKRSYREIATLELSLQEEHRSASEKQRRDQAESSSSAHPFSARFFANRVGYTSTGELDHHYWYTLTAQHRQLAELHAAFMEAAFRPGLPSSLHSLPQNYNIPTRLWHTAFHSLLERLRQTLPSMSSSNTDATSSLEINVSKQLQNEVLDILVEFIYFAYSYYSNLLESETFRSFRSSWIENLGDLARYRMAVAKIKAKEEANVKQSDLDSDEVSSRFDLLKGRHDDEVSNQGKEKGSIGSGALQDWDMEEKEVWRSTAKDWYAKGLAEMPGTGRLHHHLGILSRDDDLRALHHFCKSLTSSHPYLKARESILPLFERDLQKQRLLPDATLTDLFVYLHGILFSKVQLDDFEEIFARFKEKLDAVTASNAESITKFQAGRISQSSWMMMATINIASLLRYSTNEREQDTGSKTIIATSENIEALAGKEGQDEDDNDDAVEEKEVEGEKASTVPVSDANSTQTTIHSTLEEEPITLHYAARLTFAILFTLTSIISGQQGRSIATVNPYVTMILTFLSQECKQSTLLDVMEPHIPWKQLLNLGSHIPFPLDSIDPRKDVALRIRGDSGPLAEDWCLRGMAWVGRRIYERGFWKNNRVNGGSSRFSSYPTFESEVEVLHRFSICSSHPTDSISSESGEENDDDIEEVQAGICTSADVTTAAMLRWKRIAYTLTILVKTVPGLDYEVESGKLVLASPLLEKISNWEMDREEKLQELKHLQDHQTRLKEENANHIDEIYDGEDEDDDDELDEDEKDDSETVRDLKQRRRLLRQQIRESRTTIDRPKTLKAGLPQKRGVLQEHLPFLAGYTILILDTNVMLTPVSVLEKLVESQKWCTVIPLVTVSELEGLSKRSGIIGQRAQKAIKYLSANLKSKAIYLKVQTSRGNYLSDLRFKTEDIDFSSFQSSSNTINRGVTAGGDEENNEEKYKAARSIDEVIVYCLEWQLKHFMDKSAILLKDRQELQKTQSQITDNTFKAVLITLDLNLRLKARFRGFTALGPKTLIDVLEPAVITST